MQAFGGQCTAGNSEEIRACLHCREAQGVVQALKILPYRFIPSNSNPSSQSAEPDLG